MNEDGRRPSEPDATPTATSAEVSNNKVPALCAQPTMLEVCAYVGGTTLRILAQADNIAATADFIERTWREEIANQIHRASDRAMVERIWNAA